MFATLFTLVAVTVCFASESTFALLHLGDQYAAATSDAIRAQLLAVGQAIIRRVCRIRPQDVRTVG